MSVDESHTNNIFPVLLIIIDIIFVIFINNKSQKMVTEHAAINVRYRTLIAHTYQKWKLAKKWTRKRKKKQSSRCCWLCIFIYNLEYSIIHSYTYIVNSWNVILVMGNSPTDVSTHNFEFWPLSKYPKIKKKRNRHHNYVGDKKSEFVFGKKLQIY